MNATPGDMCEFMPEYLEQEDLDFQDEVSSKMEYRRYASDPSEQIPTAGGLFKHQAMFQRWIRFNNRAMLMDDMGTGKTRKLISSCEFYRRNMHKRPMSPENLFDQRMQGNIVGAVIIVKSNSLKANIIDEIWNYGYGGVTVTIKKRKSMKREDQRRAERANRTRLISQFYKIYTYETLANELAELSDNQIQNDYDDHLIIFDEIHNIKLDTSSYKKSQEGTRMKREDSVDVNKQISRLFTITRGCKYIIASATPMINDANEIFSIFNLVVPEDKRLFNTKVDDLSDSELADYFRGRITYVSRLDNGVDPVPVGDKPGNVLIEILDPAEMNKYQYLSPKNLSFGNNRLVQVTPDITLYTTYMSPYQTDMYNLKSGTAFYVGDRESAMFVYPGEKANYLRSTKPFMITEDLRNIIRQYGQHLSCKFDTIARLCDEENGKSFCYTEYVESGSEIMSVYMERLGYQKVDPSEVLTVEVSDVVGSSFKMNVPPGKRYAVIGSTLSQGQIEELLRFVNHPENIDGDFCKVVIGTRVARDGINLMEFVAMHLMDGGWTDSGRSQAIMRVIRAVSHRIHVARLRQSTGDENARFPVKIYQHCAVPLRPSPDKVRDVADLARRMGIDDSGDRQEIIDRIDEHTLERIRQAHNLMRTGASLTDFYSSEITEPMRFQDNAYYPGIDVATYVSGQYKSVTINRVERVMRSVAFDCGIQARRNEASNTALGIQPCELPARIDMSTYRIIDPIDSIDKLRDTIAKYFSEASTLSRENLEKLLETIRESGDLINDFPEPTIDLLADRARTTTLPILDYTGYPGKIAYEGGMFYRAPKDIVLQQQRNTIVPTSEYISVITGSQEIGILDPLENMLLDAQRPIIDKLNLLCEREDLSNVNIEEAMYRTSSNLTPIIMEVESVVRSLHPILLQRIVELAIMKRYLEDNPDAEWLRISLSTSQYQLTERTIGYLLNRYAGHIFSFNEPTSDVANAAVAIQKTKMTVRTLKDIEIKKLRPMPSSSSIVQDGQPVILHILSMLTDTINPYDIESKFNAMAYHPRVFKPEEQRVFRDATFPEALGYNRYIQAVTAERMFNIRSSRIYGVMLVDGKFHIADPFKRTDNVDRSRRCGSFLNAERVRIVNKMWETYPQMRSDLLNPRVRTRNEIEVDKALMRQRMSALGTKGTLSREARMLNTFISEETLNNDVLLQLYTEYSNMSDEEACQKLESVMRKHGLVIDQYLMPK